jgi:N-acetylneuraminic acid mutarotase
MKKRNWVYMVFAITAGLLFVAAWLSLPAAAQSPAPEKSSPAASPAEANLISGYPSDVNAVLYDQYNHASSQASSSQNFETSAADQVFRLSGSSSPLPTVSFSTASYSVNENAGSISVKVLLSAASPLTATVSYSTNDSTATAGSDYIAASGVLTFTPGVTSRTFNVSILDDATYEGNEIFLLILSSPKGATLGAPNPAMVTILDNDPIPALPCGFKTPGPWVLRNILPLPVYGLSAASDGTYAYAIGGFNMQSSVDLTQTVRYNPATNLWTGIKPLPKPVSMASAVYAPLNNRLYLFGGELAAAGKVMTSTLIYNIAGNTWSSGAPMPAGRAFMGAGYSNGKIYLAGGYSSGSVADAHAQTWEYDVLANTWLTKTSMTQPLGGAASGVVSGHLYIIGGRDGTTTARTQTYDYDIAHDSWSSKLPIPIGVNVPGTAVLNGKILVIGGGTPFLAQNGTSSLADINAPETSNTTLIFDPVLNSWTAGPNLNVPRSFIGAAGFGNFAVAMGGYTGITTHAAIEVLWECPSIYAPVISK